MQNQTYITSAALSLFWVIFLWGWWDKDLYALGINASLFLIALLFAAVRLGLGEKSFFAKKNLAWIIPFCLIALSYALYDNPFIKMFNMLAIPAFTLIFLTYSSHPARLALRWSAQFAIQMRRSIF